MPEPWRIYLLGGLRAERGEQAITRFKYQKVGGLLAYLAYHLPHVHAREVLVDTFWPESPPESARNNLSVALSSLRHQLEPPGTPAGAVILAGRSAVGLNPATVTTDVLAFEQALKAAGEGAGPAERVRHLEEALDCYQGRLLPGFYEDWIEPEQERLAGLYHDAVGALVDLLEKQGDLRAALQHARTAASVDPLREEAHQHVMRLLAVGGQPGGALRQYRELQRLLEEELGEEPSAPLRALARQIEQEAGLMGPAPALAVTHTRPRPDQRMPQSPAGAVTLTYLASDIEGSTRKWEQTGAAFGKALARHHALVRREFARHGGREIHEAGDSFLTAFQSASEALACAVACQQALLADQAVPAARDRSQPSPDSSCTPDPPSLSVRIALHTGDVQVQEGDHRGITLNHLSRMLAACHGGQILCSEVTAGLVRRALPEGVRLVDLGVWRLRDVAAPERLYQVEYAGMAAEGFPPPAAERGHAGSLPLRATRFFGRNVEIARLVALLTPGADAGARLVTLTGAAGTGKTRLAIETADVLADAYEGALWFVPLGDLTDPAQIPGAILDVLGVPRSPQRQPLDHVAERLSARRSLLVLDNMEQLLEPAGEGAADGAAVVRGLLDRVPGLAVAVTSRRLLGLAGEHEFAVPPMPAPDVDAAKPDTRTPERLSACDSVRLFADRAQQAMPHFQVTNHNAAAVAELCSRLEGIPLAIELAAARALVMTPAQILPQGVQRFRCLVNRKRDAPERHRSLEAAIEWSYRLLSPEVQRFLRRLSVFRGGWTAEAAEAVCEEPLALDCLASLREDSLIVADETAQGMRFRMLETVREFAWERLEADERAGAAERHLAYFLGFAEEAARGLVGAEQAAWLERLERDHSNMRACLHSSMGPDGATIRTLRLCAALWRFWMVRGYLAEGRSSLEEALRIVDDREAHGCVFAMVTEALRGAAALADHQSDYPAAKRLLERGLAIARRRGDAACAAAFLSDLGLLSQAEGRYLEAEALHCESLAIRRELGDPQAVAASLVNLGSTALHQGDIARARSLREESLAICRQLGNPEGIAVALISLGSVAFSQADYTAAHSLYSESLQLYRGLGYRRGVAASLHNLGDAASAMGNGEEARQWYAEALEAFGALGDRACIAYSLEGLAGLASFREAAAVRAYAAAEALRLSTGAPIPPAERERRARQLADARDRMGEAAFAAAWEQGATLSWQEAAALVTAP